MAKQEIQPAAVAAIEAMRLYSTLARLVIERFPVAGMRHGTDELERDAEIGPGVGIEPMVPPIDHQAMAHFVLVQAMLTPDEAIVARTAMRELSPGELRAWFESLSRLSIADAAARVRKLIATGGAS